MGFLRTGVFFKNESSLSSPLLEGGHRSSRRHVLEKVAEPDTRLSIVNADREETARLDDSPVMLFSCKDVLIVLLFLLFEEKEG
jgi:hypothetical protein